MEHKTKTAAVIIGLLIMGIAFNSCTKEKHYHYGDDGPSASGRTVTDNPGEILPFETLASEYTKGEKLRLRVNRTGNIVEEYEVTFDGTYEYDGERLIFCKTPAGLIVGAGDSGSPLLTTDGKVVGTLCYGFEFANRQFAARAIEDVLKLGDTPAEVNAVQRTTSGNFMPLKPVYQVTGMNRDQFIRYTRNDDKGYFSNYAPRAGKQNVFKAATTDVTLIPGHSICMLEISGDVLNFTATGTASFIRDNEIYGFGHAYNGSPPVAMPARLASMVTMIESDWEAFKLSVPAEQSIGAMTKDAFEGILIRSDLEGAKFDYHCDITLPDGTVMISNHQVAQFIDIGRENYHAANLGPYLMYSFISADASFRADADGSITIIYEDGTYEENFHHIDDSHWIDIVIAGEFEDAISSRTGMGHILSVEFTVVLTAI